MGMKRCSSTSNVRPDTEVLGRARAKTVSTSPTVAIALLALLGGLTACQRPGAEALSAGAEAPIQQLPGESSAPISSELTPIDSATVGYPEDSRADVPLPPTVNGSSPPAPPATALPVPSVPVTPTPVSLPASPDGEQPPADTPAGHNGEVAPPVGDVVVTAGPKMSDASIRAAVDPHHEANSVEIVAWGDVDGDGNDDAIVLAGWCGASCGTTLDLVLATQGGAMVYRGPNGEAFAPFYNGGGATQSSLSSATIDDGEDVWQTFGGSTIQLVGTNLCVPDVQSEWNDCGPTERYFVFIDGHLEPIV